MALLCSSLSLSQYARTQRGHEICTLFPRHPDIPPQLPMSHQGPCPAAIEGPDPVVLGRLLCARVAVQPVPSGLSPSWALPAPIVGTGAGSWEGGWVLALPEP